MLMFILCFLVGCGYVKQAPEAKDGVLDLTDWDLERDGVVRLNGEWEFYWRQLLTPEEFAKKQGLEKPEAEKMIEIVPRSWSKYKFNDENLESDGYATFRLKVWLKNFENIAGIKLPEIYTSYKLWINGKVYNSIGKVGETREEFSPGHFPDTVYFGLQNHENHEYDRIDEIEIIIQAANFMHRRGGIWQPLILGTAKQIKNIREKRLFSDAFLFTSLMIIGFYQTVIYFTRRKDIYALYLGVLSFILSIRTLFLGEMYLVSLLPAVPQELLLKAEYLTLCFGMVFCVLYLESLFPDKVNKKICLSFKLSGLLFAIFVIFTPVRVFNKLLIVIQLIVVVAGLYSIGIINHAILKEKKEKIVIFFGALFLYGTVINDILFYNEIIFTGNYSSFGLFIFIATHSLMITIRHSIAFSRAERVSQHLVAIDKLKDDFLVCTSNELHSPLKGIIGITECMIEGATGKLNAMQLSNLLKIASSARRLFNLVNDIVDFSKIKNNSIILDKKPVDIKQVSKLVFELYKPIVSEKMLELKNNISTGTPLVYGDENRIQQIIYNLLSNTIKNTDFGIVTINVKVVGEMLEIVIADTGKGIPSNELESIFEPLTLERSYLWSKYGTGSVSLSIAKYLVELHGGEIRVESGEDKGTSFIFTLPIYNEKVAEQYNSKSITEANNKMNTRLNGILNIKLNNLFNKINYRKAQEKKQKYQYAKKFSHKYKSIFRHKNISEDKNIFEDKTTLEDESTLKKSDIVAETEIDIIKGDISQKSNEEYIENDDYASIKPDGKFNILVADDDPVDLQMMVNFLSLERYNVTEIINGDEVISRIRENKVEYNKKFDLLVLDIMMPKISGYEICKTLRKEFSIFELPILMLTRKGQYDDVMAGFKAGANDCISKPFDRRELLTRVGTLLVFKHSVETAIVNARNLEAEINRRTFAETLGEFSKALTSTLELNEVLERFLEKLNNFVLFDSGMVMLKEGIDFRVVSNIGCFDANCSDIKDIENALIIPKNSALIKTILKNQMPVIIGDAQKDKRYCICENNRCDKKSLLAVPIVNNDEVLGIVLLQDKKKDAFSEYDAEIVYNFAAQSGIAIKNAKLFAEIKKLATIDDLTKLNNRRHFFVLAEREFKLYKRYKNLQNLSMIILDVDDFKKINDTYGHHMGDDVLRTVAEKCMETLRETDVIGRYGGEEYTILLPQAGRQEAQKVAERLKKNISMQPIIFNGINIYVTVSIGVAVLNDSINNLDELLQKADIALYEAKRKGKNCIVVL